MKKNQKNFIIFGVISICILSLSSQYLIPFTKAITNQDLSRNLTRNLGIGLGNKIQGKFSYHGEGSADVVKMTLKFNGIEVASSQSNELTFKFTTDDYPQGETIITLTGWDANGYQISISDTYEFLAPEVQIYFILATILIVGGALLFKYRDKIKKFKKGNSDMNSESHSEKIKIEKI